ncbi:MAG: XrtA/PEP-CTERM system histidine kinase PrsK [Burkholderiales bacterium]
MTGDPLITFGLWSYGLAAAGLLVFALRLGIGWRPGLRASLLLASVLANAAWAGANVLVLVRPDYAFWTAANAVDTVRYALWFAFLAALLVGAHSPDGKPVPQQVPPWLVAVAIIGLVASAALPYAPPSMVVAQPGARIGGLVARVGLAVLGLLLVEQVFWRAEPGARWALRPLCIGIGGVFAFDLYLFADALLFSHLNSQVWLARGAANALVIPFIAMATARNPTWTIEMHLSRRAVLHSTTVLLSGLFLLFVAGAGYVAQWLDEDWGRALQIEVFFAAVLVGLLAVTSGAFRARLRVFISKHFFSYRYDYREEWMRFTRALAGATRVRDVQLQAIQALANLVESPAGVLWLRSEDGNFRSVAQWNLPASDAVESPRSSLVTFLERTGWVVDLGEYRSEPSRYPDLMVPEWLAEVPAAWLLVPLSAAQEFAGFVVLAEPRAKLSVNWEVRDLLKIAGIQAASYLGQLRATEALVEAQKFDAFNRMSAFVVHDLKNLVAQLSLMLKNAERHRDNPEFQRDMLSTVEHVVGRMNHLMLQLRTGAKPVGNPRLVDMATVIRAVCRTREKAHVPIELELAPGIMAVGHEDRLDHVIGHLLQNALDATPPGGAPVAVRLGRDAASVMVEIADRGAGMTPEFVRDRLFRPFETSKPSGMGIGVYESAQYLASIGGTLHFDSAAGAGTRAVIRLPAGDGAKHAARTEPVT